MSTRIVSLIALTVALLGTWLPSLWLPAESAVAPRPQPVVPPEVSPPAPQETLRAAILRQHSPMAMLQTAVAGVAERRFTVSASLEDLNGFGFTEVEVLARSLAGEAAGRSVKDGTAFLKTLAQQDSESFQFNALQAWGDTDPDAALAGLIKTSADGLMHRYYFIRVLAARNPDKALAMLREAPAGPNSKYLWSAALTGCADKGPGVALKAIQSAPADSRARAVHSVLDILATADPRAALAWQETLPPELKSMTNPDTVFEAWAKTDPAAAANEWVKIRGNKEPPYNVVQSWAYEDPETLFQWARDKGPAFGQSITLAIEGISVSDPDKAMQMLTGTSEELRKATLPTMGMKRAREDPRAALTWMHSLAADDQPAVLAQMLPHLSTLPVEDRRAIAQEVGPGTPAGFQFLYELNPAEAEKTLTKLSTAEAMTVCKAMSGRLAASSPAAAAPFVTTLVRALSDPASAAALAVAPAVSVEFSDDNFGSGSSSSSSSSAPLNFDDSAPAPAPDPATLEVVETVARLTTNWSALDPAPAAAWIATLPAGKPQAAAAVNLALTWGRYDLPAARAWVEQLPPGEAREKAAAQITRLTESAAPNDSP